MSTTSIAQAPIASSAPAADALLGLGALGKIGLALLGVIGLILLCAWLLRRFGGTSLRLGAHLRVVGSSALGQRERLVLVEMAGTWLLLGVTASQISKLHEMPAPAAQADATMPESSSGQDNFASRLAQALRHNLGRAPRGEA